MGKFIIDGGQKLFGEIKIGGAKNSALPVLAACLLPDGESLIGNCPDITDVRLTLEILKMLGCETDMAGGNVRVRSSKALCAPVDDSVVRRMRSSVLFLGAMLGRFRVGRVCMPGGCSIGERPIDIHIRAFREMGVKVCEDGGFITCDASGAYPANIQFNYPSVGATENIMIFASTLEGETVIDNAACEPEIVDLADFLNKCGAKISGAGTPVIRILGGQRLNGADHSLIPDRIEAGTYMCAAAAAGGELFLSGARLEDMKKTVQVLCCMGACIREYNGGVYIKSPDLIKPVGIMQTLPYPGLPTDMQPQLMAVLTMAEGLSIIVETVFEARYKHVDELIKMGAKIETEGFGAAVHGVPALNGANVLCKDLRGGAALVIAGLAANGRTVVEDISYIERGYQSMAERLSAVGAHIQKA